ncbi:MAG TPA: TIGR03435 family protein [Candidatus Acidoferrales bacterium]|nr:TIGR03435 family protein [Candidatus Acidoferrales bacterium]
MPATVSVMAGVAIFVAASWAGGTPQAGQAQASAQTQAQQSASTSATTASGATPATSTPVEVPTNLEYEVASFKVNKEGGGSSSWSNGGDALTARNVSLLNMVINAYGVKPFQISGAPSWLDSERYDVDAKMDDATADMLKKLPEKERTEAVRLMMQKLFEQRLKLAVRHDTKEMPVYFLVIGKSGPKLKDMKPDEKGGSTHTSSHGGIFTMNAQGVQLGNLVGMLSNSLGRIVIDKTGLTGRYDFDLNWTSDDHVALAPSGGDASLAVSDASGPSLVTAIQEQLGLKLETGKGPVEIIVIERVERPSDN